MNFDYSSTFNNRSAEAYERVISDAIKGDQSLFASNKEVIATWSIIQNVLDQWSKTNKKLIHYPIGSNINKLIN